MLTIFHLSDLHFGEGISRDKEVPRKISKKIKGLEEHDLNIWTDLRNHLTSTIKQIDNDYRICVTGDLSRIGSIESYNLASKFFFDESDSEISKALGLRLKRDKFIIAPGNHDSYDESYRKINNLRTFNGVFHSSEEEYPIVKNIEVNNTKYSFVALDSTYKKNGGNIIKKLGKGNVDKEQLERVKGHFLDHTKDSAIKVLLLHHSPIIVDRDRKRSLMLDKSRNVLESIVNSGFNIVLCGHLHDDFYDILPLKRLIKFLPKKRGFGRVIKDLFKETQLNDYYPIVINGKKARYFDSIAYHYIKEHNDVLRVNSRELNSLKKFESYLYNHSKYKEFVDDFYSLTDSETALIMAGSACKEKEKENSYLELMIEDDLGKMIIKRHKYNKDTRSFVTKTTTKLFKKSV
ncbi:metallophosphoesterase [Carboxylicivirga sediminis]|uniref:Metallophosphoesterase n=1 Tax=Carboxylicivirga sediminis TaxID=2006564 RepID=A0A941F2R1_9BACT|nr:metallophosphoesterase [Carboxylicivirga sediminis]MBR8534670.1 metallophosphoesterase [Carboxylicivirga sediminis]